MSILPDGRYISDAPYDEHEDLSTIERADLDMANWKLVWREFRKHRLGLIAGVFLLVSYLMLPFAGFVAPYTPNERHADHLYAPPQGIHLFHDGKFIGPYVLPMTARADLVNYRWEYDTDTTTPMPLEFFCEGDSYKLAGLIKTSRHLVCAPDVGLIGITVSFLLGITFGSIAGYFAGRTDWTIQRVIEIYPWAAIPMLPIIIIVLAFSFFGDGLRDSLDPYKS